MAERTTLTLAAEDQMIAIELLSRVEKLRMMEALWRNLAADARGLDSPDWHHAALMEGEAALAEGLASWLDWPHAKELLRVRSRA